jgi:hypothetical protein
MEYVPCLPYMPLPGVNAQRLEAVIVDQAALLSMLFLGLG